MLGNVATQFESAVEFDSVGRKILNNAAANQLLREGTNGEGPSCGVRTGEGVPWGGYSGGTAVTFVADQWVRNDPIRNITRNKP